MSDLIYNLVFLAVLYFLICVTSYVAKVVVIIPDQVNIVSWLVYAENKLNEFLSRRGKI